MNLTELITLSQEPNGPEKIRIMVAELDGYKLIPWQGIDFYYINPTEEERVLARDGNMTGAFRDCNLPPYTTSLDEIMPLVKELKNNEQELFVDSLYEMSGKLDWDAFAWCITQPTPLQMCIAFLAANNHETP